MVDGVAELKENSGQFVREIAARLACVVQGRKVLGGFSG
jgi:hypothetical protein